MADYEPIVKAEEARREEEMDAMLSSDSDSESSCSDGEQDSEEFASTSIDHPLSASITASTTPHPTHLNAKPESSTQATFIVASSNGVNDKKPAILLPISNDGVFANLSAKPDTIVQIPSYPASPVQEVPPTYADVQEDSVPPYPSFRAILAGMHLSDGQNESGAVVGRYPAGPLSSFIISACVAYAFHFLGLLLALIFSQTHAGHLGARAGFGIAMIQFGMVSRNRSAGYTYTYDGTVSETPSEKEDSAGVMISYMVILLGWVMMFQALGEYFRIRRLEKLVIAASGAGGDAEAAAVVSESAV
eukprot:Partr_v1_DN26994_c2_g1_i1_m6978 putative Nedd4 family interacting protein